VRENGVVSIATNRQGRRACRVPLLDGTLVVATGAPALALATGAPVLPVVTVEQDGFYRTIVMERLSRPRAMSREDAMLQMTREFATRLEPFVASHPEQLD
jgi:lauroyl/myristoyl acyltransferase